MLSHFTWKMFFFHWQDLQFEHFFRNTPLSTVLIRLEGTDYSFPLIWNFTWKCIAFRALQLNTNPSIVTTVNYIFTWKIIILKSKVIKEIEQQKSLSCINPETAILLRVIIAIFCMSARNWEIISNQPKENFLNRTNYLKVLEHRAEGSNIFMGGCYSQSLFILAIHSWIHHLFLFIYCFYLFSFIMYKRLCNWFPKFLWFLGC